MGYDQLVRPVRAGQGGEFSTLNPNQVNLAGPAFMKQLINCTLENDLWETEPGTFRMNPMSNLGGATVGTLFQFFPFPGVPRLIACGRDGTVWKSGDDGKNWRRIVQGLLQNTLAVPVVGGAELAGSPKKAFVFGMGPTQVLAGDADIDAPIPTPVVAPTAAVKATPGAIN